MKHNTFLPIPLYLFLVLISFASSAQILNIEDPTLTKDSLSKHDFKYGFGANFNLSQCGATLFKKFGV